MGRIARCLLSDSVFMVVVMLGGVGVSVAAAGTMRIGCGSVGLVESVLLEDTAGVVTGFDLIDFDLLGLVFLAGGLGAITGVVEGLGKRVGFGRM